MSYEDLQAAITGRMQQDQTDAATEQAESRERLLGPLDQRPAIVEMDKLAAMRGSDPEMFATYPADMRRRATDHAEWRKTHPKKTTGDAA